MNGTNIPQPTFKQGDLLVEENYLKQKTIWLVTQDVSNAVCVYSEGAVLIGSYSSIKDLRLAIFGGTVHISCSVIKEKEEASEFSMSFDPRDLQT